MQVRIAQSVECLRDILHLGAQSMGGLMAGYMGLRYSRTFGNVLSQSGSFGASADAVRGAENGMSGMESALAESYSEEPDWLIEQVVARLREIGGR